MGQLFGSEPIHPFYDESNQNTVFFSFSWQGTLLERIPSDRYTRIYSELKTCKFQGMHLPILKNQPEEQYSLRFLHYKHEEL